MARNHCHRNACVSIKKNDMALGAIFKVLYEFLARQGLRLSQKKMSSIVIDLRSGVKRNTIKNKSV